MKLNTKRNKNTQVIRFSIILVIFISVLIISGAPVNIINAQDERGFPHMFWGKVTTDDGQPASGVQVTAWVNGVPGNTITTDTSGQYGTDPLVGSPYYIHANGQDGDIIEFRVNGTTVQEMRLGTLIETQPPFWQWQDLVPSWQAIFHAGQVNTLDLVYTPSIDQDTTAPAAITNMTVNSVTTNTITLTWTASGDDDNQGTASSYDIRYLTEGPLNNLNWDEAIAVTDVRTPNSSGQQETVVVEGLETGTTYYFAIRVADEAGNWSAISSSLNINTGAAAKSVKSSTSQILWIGGGVFGGLVFIVTIIFIIHFSRRRRYKGSHY